MNKQVNKNLVSVLPGDDVLQQCMHCGMCLAVCPTYDLTKEEKSSPRGRIRLIKAVAHGEMKISEIFIDEMDFCLDCQACETACPAGVKYGSMVEAARVEVENAGHISLFGKIIKAVTLRHIVKKKKLLKFTARLLYIYQNSLHIVLHKSGLFKLLFPRLAEVDKLSPKVSRTFSDSVIKTETMAIGEKKYKFAFLSGCLMDVMFADINIQTVELLSKIGGEIVTPKGQECCGSLQAHNGDMKTALELARLNIDVFSKCEYDYLIANSAGCGAFMKEYGHLLKDDEQYGKRAEEFSSKVKDITEFFSEHLSEIKFQPLEDTITYHDACHLAHTQKIVNQPRNVLNAIPGLVNIPLENSTTCCGSAGIYNIVRYDDSMKILEKKMNNIKKTGAKKVLAGNPGCIQQLKYGAEKFNVDVEVLHPVEVINKSIK